MKILQVEQIREADAYTIAHEPVSSEALMERASNAFVQAFTKQVKPGPVCIMAGTGNNGGDGMVVARLLSQMGYQVNACMVKFEKGKGSDDFNKNRVRLEKLMPIQNIMEASDFPELTADTIIIDALFGSGLSRPIEGLYAEVVNQINRHPGDTVALDMPSGLFADRHSEGDAIIKAAHTITFELPKMAFLMPENEKFVGQWERVSIGLSSEFISQAATPFYWVDSEMIRPLRKMRRAFAHKGDFGKVLLAGGSYGSMGAAVLMARSCLKAGAGLVTVCIPKVGYEVLQTAVPEAMVIPGQEDQSLADVPDLSPYTAFGVGPGMGTSERALSFFHDWMRQQPTPLVIDADGINLIAAHHGIRALIPPQAILTPHPGELARLAGAPENDFDQLQKAREFAQERRCIVVLKGRYTAICHANGEVYFNSTGNPGMSTAGSGDVLTGIIASLLGQGYEAEQAARLGVYLHGKAGDLARDALGEASVMASDLIEYLPAAYLSVWPG